MNTTDFGPAKPSIQPYLNGYSVPAGLKQVERPAINGEGVEHSWQGYLLIVPFLSELELDAAIARLPAGDYSADKQAALVESVKLARRASYPPQSDLLYAIAEDDAAAIATYKAKCVTIAARHPMPWCSTETYKAGAIVTHKRVIYRKLDDGDDTEPDATPGGWEIIS
jgi:hypothetical protein